MRFMTICTPELLKEIEEKSSIKWFDGFKPTERDDITDALVALTLDENLAIFQPGNCIIFKYTILDKEAFIAKCAERKPKKSKRPWCPGPWM